MQIIPYSPTHLDAVVRLSLDAWTPVFESICEVLGEAIYQPIFPDWRASQKQAVEEVCSSEQNHVWVSVVDDAVAGFVAVQLDDETSTGIVYMIAVDPAFQRRGIATALMEFATDWIKDAGMEVVMVSTGGDPGHAPARRTYESLGFTALPVVQYYKKV